MTSKFQSDDGEGEGNLFSKVLNGMKTVFNADTVKKNSSKKAAIVKQTKIQSSNRSADSIVTDASTSESNSYRISNEGAILIPISKDSVCSVDSTKNGPNEEEKLANPKVLSDATSICLLNENVPQFAVLSLNPNLSTSGSEHERACNDSLHGSNISEVFDPNLNPSQDALEVPVDENNPYLKSHSSTFEDDSSKSDNSNSNRVDLNETPDRLRSLKSNSDRTKRKVKEQVEIENSIEKTSTIEEKKYGLDDIGEGLEDIIPSKPRIVLKFRSEKSGLRSTNMKIVSDHEKVNECNKTYSVGRRSLRGKTLISETYLSEESRKEAKKRLSPIQEGDCHSSDVKSNISGNSESDDSVKTSQSSRKKRIPGGAQSDSNSEDSPSVNSSKVSIKRSARRRSKDFSENILASAMARKEKILEAANSGHTRLSRRIKPTAKILANRELRIGLETQNNARLGLVSEKNAWCEEGKITRSKLKKSPEKLKNSMLESLKPSNERGKKKNKAELHIGDKKNSSDEEKIEVIKCNKKYLTSDEINQCILGTSYVDLGEKKICDLQVETITTPNEFPPEEEIEHKRINKLKKKHLKKLGLTAVSGQNKKQVKDRENLTDESTMDSINTEAIIEHLNNRTKILNNSPNITDKSDELFETSNSTPDKNIDVEEKLIESKKQKNKHQKRKLSLSDSEDSLVDRIDSDNNDEDVSVRVTRKRSRISNSNSNDPNESLCRILIDDKNTVNSLSCFCTASSNLYAYPESLTDTEFCRAIETIANRTIGCGRPVTSGRLIRAGPRAPFILACDMHHYRLSLHHCCAGCGVFCTQGPCYQCSEGHLFHWECSLPFVSTLIPTGQADQAEPIFDQQPSPPKGTLTDIYNSTPGCPHCGINPSTMQPSNLDCFKVNLEMQCSTPMILLPNPRLQWVPARMSFSSKKYSSYDTLKNEKAESSVLPKDLLHTIKCNIEKLNSKKDNFVDYDELLIKVNCEIPKDMDLIKAVCDKENTIENIIDAINSGCDPKKHIPHVDNGTFLHLAARELNLSALHIFKTLGCELDALDVEYRTPLMLAVMNFDTEIVDRIDGAKDENAVETEQNIDNDNQITDELADPVSENKNNKPDDENEEIKIIEKEKELVGHQKEYRMIIDYLLKAGSDVSLKGPNGATILHLAAKYGDLITCSTILDDYSQCFKSFINQKDDGGWTPLVWAVENKRNVIVRYLLEKGADLTLRDSENNIALHWAAMVGCSKIMEDLLNFGSQVNVVNLNGDTPLHLSARQNHYNCLILLLARGAQIDLKNSENETPLDCVSNEKSECYSALTINMHLQKIMTPANIGEKTISLDISNGKELNPIRCVNSVDKDDLNGKFIYITKNCLTVNINIDRKISSMQGCECTDGCGQAENNCPCANLSMQCWYDAEGRLVPNFDYSDPPMIFECNDACSCNKMRCVNRGLDKGTRVTLKVFRQKENTARGGGWAVCTLQPISKGSLVTEYVGEILPGDLAYHRDDDSYLFELEMKDDVLEEPVEPYCIDAKHYGNVSRFINHKCEPNLVPVRVFVDHRDLHFPRIAFFACRDIDAGEELGFDYGPKFWNVKIKSFTCHCNSDLCRYSKKDSDKSDDEISELEETEILDSVQ